MRFVLALLILILPIPSLAASDADARALVARLEREAIAMASPRLAMAEKERRFRALIRSAFNMPGISQFVLGRHWRIATPSQRQEFIRLFEEISTDIWVPRFRDYGGERMDIISVQPAADGFLVETVVRSPQGRDTPVTWRLSETPAGLRVVDIIVEGVSMALTHRSEYTSVLRTAGGVDGLLGRMRQQVAAAAPVR